MRTSFDSFAKPLRLLNRISGNKDVRQLDLSLLQPLADECREYLISTILESGGHFAGNLGVVELTVALLHKLNPAHDKVIWDVGHQSYVYKILTGRRDRLNSIRSFSGLSGFPSRSESDADAFGTGHSSTAISAALGIAVANRLQGHPEAITAAVVGDGALTGGMAFEALNNAVSTGANVLIIINDNHMGIDPNTGAIDQHLQQLQTDGHNIFRDLGLPYRGPVDGHDMEALLNALDAALPEKGPRVLHVRTIKGKGYAPAEAEQTRWHSTSRFVKIDRDAQPSGIRWHDAAGQILHELAQKDPTITGITPAMPTGSGLLDCFRDFPDRFFDVGIAEQHAATFAAGLAAGGMKPCLVVYSTFLQRGYDQVIHDIALQNLPVVICIDRAGLVGEDGPTHHGVFDIPFLACIPNMKILAPAWPEELRLMMTDALGTEGPVAIRYPKGHAQSAPHHPETIGPLRLKDGRKTAVVSTGLATLLAMEASSDEKFTASHYHMPVIKPLDAGFVAMLASRYSKIVTVEDGAIAGGMGHILASALYQAGFSGNITHLGVPDAFIPHGANPVLYEFCGYAPEDILQAARA